MALDTTSYILGKKAGESGTPTSYSELTNKPSINGTELIGNSTSDNLGVQSKNQYTTLPTASADTVGKIVQYIGETTNTYTNGYFYLGTSEESGGTTTYSWTNINTQAQTDISGKQDLLVSGTNIKTINDTSLLGSGNINISGGGNVYVINNTSSSPNTVAIDNDATKPVMQNILDAIDTTTKSFNGKILMVSATAWGYGQEILECSGIQYENDNMQHLLALYFKPKRLPNSTTSYGISKRQTSTYYVLGNVNSSNIITGCSALKIFENNIIESGDWLATNNTSAYTPTGNYNPATKKYVDDKPTTYSGYDATKTQVLKNVNGTITWVDDVSPTGTATLTLTYQDENGNTIVPDNINVMNEYNPGDQYEGDFPGSTTTFTLAVGERYLFAIRKQGYNGAGNAYTLAQDTTDTITMTEEVPFTEIEFVAASGQSNIPVGSGVTALHIYYEDENGDQHDRQFGSTLFNGSAIDVNTTAGTSESKYSEIAPFINPAGGTDVTVSVASGYHFDESGNPTSKVYTNVTGEIQITLPLIVSD